MNLCSNLGYDTKSPLTANVQKEEENFMDFYLALVREDMLPFLMLGT